MDESSFQSKKFQSTRKLLSPVGETPTCVSVHRLDTENYTASEVFFDLLLHKKVLTSSVLITSIDPTQHPSFMDLRVESNDQFDFNTIFDCCNSTEFLPGDTLVMDNAAIHKGDLQNAYFLNIGNKY